MAHAAYGRGQDQLEPHWSIWLGLPVSKITISKYPKVASNDACMLFGSLRTLEKN